MNYPLFAISIIGITAFGIMLLTYLWEKCVIGGEGLQGNYASDDEEEEEELAAGASADTDTDTYEIDEAVEQYIHNSEDLFYERLHEEIKVYRKLLEDRAAAAKAASQLPLPESPTEPEPEKPQISNLRRRRNKSF
jgi:hypothetical protein